MLQFMGIEIDPKYGGTGSSFTAACIMVEELARVDAAVSVCADVQNTLVNNVFAVSDKNIVLSSLFVHSRK